MTEKACGIEYWSSPDWLAGARTWLDERLAAAGLERTGDVDQAHLAPWSTVLCAPTSGGRVWLKAEGPAAASRSSSHIRAPASQAGEDQCSMP